MPRIRTSACRWKVAACALLALMLLGFACRPARAAAPPVRAADFFGVQDWDDPSAEDFQTMHDTGLQTFRQNLIWGQIEAQPGERDWGRFDTVFANAAQAGIRILPVLISSPTWAAADYRDPPATPAGVAAWPRFVADAVRRYGPGGDFWTEHPELPALPPTAWEVWNEPNYPAFWHGAPSVREYGRLLAASSAAIRAVDPSAKVLVGGLSNSKRGVPMLKYLTSLYRLRGSRRWFDVVAIHPYASEVGHVQDALAGTRQVMDRHGDARTPIWITELGWSTGGPASTLTTSEAGQAARMTTMPRLLLRDRARYGLAKVLWFCWRDRPLYDGERDWWGPHTGLVTSDYRPKPAWRAFRAVVGAYEANEAQAAATAARRA